MNIEEMRTPKLRRATTAMLCVAAGGVTLGALLLVAGSILFMINGAWVVVALGGVSVATGVVAFPVAKAMTRTDLRRWGDDVMGLARASGIHDVEGLMARIKEQQQQQRDAA